MKKSVLITALACFTWSASVYAGLTVSGALGDHMVLQREMPVKIWGKADAGSKVTVTFKGQSQSGICDERGKYLIELKPMQASAEGAELTVTSGNEKVVLKDILVGEVWFCSGQSNMFMPLWSSSVKYRQKNGDKIVAKANYPQVRFAVSALRSGFMAQENAELMLPWQAIQPGKSARLSAVAYFFGTRLHEELQVPVGLICSSWGGTPIETWIAPSGLASRPEGAELYRKVQRRTPGTSAYESRMQETIRAYEQYLQQLKKSYQDKTVPSVPPVFPSEYIPDKRGNHWDVAGNYNRMVKPFTPMALRGVIWYQGCSNMGDGMSYKWKMAALLDGWRKEFANEKLSFYFVQLAPFRWFKKESLAGIWEAQRTFAIESGAKMAVINDVGDWLDIHPADKTQVGYRLANLALKYDFKRSDIPADFPELTGMLAGSDQAVLSFANVKQFRARDGKKISGFEVAGSDAVFKPASATINGAQIILHAPNVGKIRQVRYLWSDPNAGNLSAETGLPLGEFVFDDRSADEISVSRRGGKHMIYLYDMHNSWNARKIKYTVDNSGKFPGRKIKRVYYYLELVHKNGNMDYVCVSFDPFTGNLSQIGVPHVSHKGIFQQNVTNMEIRSNVKGLTCGKFPTGNIEFTPHNYTPVNSKTVPNALNEKYDAGDNFLKDGAYGCMQVHNYALKETVFGYSGFIRKKSADIGIGNATIGNNPDWTHSQSGANYIKANMWISVDFL
ncbi:MAG: hypothetical protein J5858_02540 [Lentisphaeria bacterium]|nr:hypothetical protein [Lentisphaeria bacterium]